MHHAVLKNESIRDLGGSPVPVSWGYFQSIIPRTSGSTLCFRKWKRKRADESISAEKGRAFAYMSVSFCELISMPRKYYAGGPQFPSTLSFVLATHVFFFFTYFVKLSYTSMYNFINWAIWYERQWRKQLHFKYQYVKIRINTYSEMLNFITAYQGSWCVLADHRALTAAL